MGASQSDQKRTVSMENPTGVIDVSDEVVQRLRSGLSKNERAKKGNTTAANKPVKATSTETESKKVPSTAGNEAKLSTINVPSSYPNPTPFPPPGMSFGEPTITAIEVRRQKEAELAQNDLYWRRHIAQLEQTLNKTNAIMEKEYSATVVDVRNRFQNAPPIHQLPPCQDLKAQLIACYRAHPGETLQCAEEVAAFTHCVSENHTKKLDNPI